MNINTNKIMGALGNKDLQKLAGYWMYASKEFHDGAIDGSLRMVDALMKDPHIPNFSHVIDDLRRSDIIKTLITLGLGGWIASELNIHPQLTRFGKLAKGFAINGGTGVAIGSVIRHASLAHSPGDSSSGGSSSSGGWGT